METECRDSASVVRPKLLWISPEAVIPAPISIGMNSNGNLVQKYWIPGQARNDNQSNETFDPIH